jgi:hypothetical protein
MVDGGWLDGGWPEFCASGGVEGGEGSPPGCWETEEREPLARSSDDEVFQLFNR